MANRIKHQAMQYGSDLIIEILQQYGIEYVACNPGATFRGLHDSLVNYKNNTKPELILCCHEEIAVAIAHGYAKASGKFMAVFVHSNVGLQHASMAIFNAWCDRVPVLIICGVGPLDTTKRRPWIDWIHTSNDQGSIVRDYVKWVDQPYNLASVSESIYRACKIMNTEPKAPVYIGIDALIQEAKLTNNYNLPDVTKYSPPILPQASAETLTQVAQLLVKAEFPVIVVDYMGRNAASVQKLVELAELLSIPVIDCGGRYNFPNNHSLCLTGIKKSIFENADFVLALDVNDLANVFGEASKHDRSYRSYLNSFAKVAHITMADYLVGKWAADYHKLSPVDITVAADTSIVLPELIALCKQMNLKNKAKKYNSRLKIVSNMHQKLRHDWCAYAESLRDQSPLAIPAVIREIWQAVKNEDWILTNNASVAIGKWLKKLWIFAKAGCYIGESGGAGLGYGIGASIGAALVYKNTDKLCINIQADGDLLFTPSALWTIAHYKIPLLIIVMNNRSYGNTTQHALEIANHRNRNRQRAHIGNAIDGPAVNFPKLAKSFGLTALPTITELIDIVPTIRKAITIIKQRQEAVFIDILIQ